MSDNKIKCSICSQELEESHMVYIDVLNTLTHVNCGTVSTEVKDYGSFTEMTSKYPYFNL